jgi:hypothetical protein
MKFRRLDSYRFIIAAFHAKKMAEPLQNLFTKSFRKVFGEEAGNGA